MAPALTRRNFLAGAAVVAGAGALPASSAFAAAPPASKQAPTLYRYKIGSYELTALSDGLWERPIDDKFVRNADPADVRKAMTDAFMPATDKLPIPFTALLVNTVVQDYHFPFPASGYIVRSGSGYELIPVEWRPL